jgi:hypothetical protein
MANSTAAQRFPWALYPDTSAVSAAQIWAYWGAMGVMPPQVPADAGPYVEGEGATSDNMQWERIAGPTPSEPPAPVPTTQPTTRPALSQPPQPTSRPSGPTSRPAGGYGGGANAGPGGVPMTDLHMSTSATKGRAYPEQARAEQAARTASGGQPLNKSRIPATQPAAASEPPQATGAPQRTTRIIQDDTHGATPEQYAAYKKAGFVWIPNPGKPPKGVDQSRWGHWGKAVNRRG